MAHISVDLPSISQAQKKKLIESMQEILSEIAEISVSLHELPRENMNTADSSISDKKSEKSKSEKVEKEVKKKSFFKEMFP